MRISDWSSDVCSSDLPRALSRLDLLQLLLRLQPAAAGGSARPRPAAPRAAGHPLRERRHLHQRWRLLRLLLGPPRAAPRARPLLPPRRRQLRALRPRRASAVPLPPPLAAPPRDTPG